MKFRRRRPPLMLILVVAMLALLPVLAVLQYRWLGQVSRGERERMQASLSAATEQFSQDFDRELTRAFFSFQPDASVLTVGKAGNYSEAFDQWVATAPRPPIVNKIFRVVANDKGAVHLLELDQASARFEPRDWPAEMSALRERFEDSYQTKPPEAEVILEDRHLFRMESPKVGHGLQLVLGSRMGPIAEDVPALIIPLPNFVKAGERESLGPIFPSGYIAATLNLDYIKKELIPALANRYFSSGRGLDYNLAIVSRDGPRKTIYESEPNVLEGNSSGDATANLLSVRFNEIENELLEKAVRSGETSQQTGAEKNRLSIRAFNRPIRATFSAQSLMAEEEGRWQIILKHRAGSLDAAVAVARRQNLVISSGILLLLTASMALIIISTQRAQRLARQQMEFVAGISHELRTPLAVIHSAAENLADGVVDRGGQVRRYGALIKNESSRLAEMVEQVLEFAGAQSGRKTYNLRPVEAGDLVEGAVATCLPQINEGDFIIEKEIPPGLPPVMGDAAALRRSIQNLLSNAMKYGGESRRVRIKARAVSGDRGPELQITVEDKGAGIPASELRHLFEPFYRGRASVAAQIHGSGLGLSLVRHIIEAHGGRVSVASAPGKGSAFTLHLPTVDRADVAR